jgi:hypothetical protein
LGDGEVETVLRRLDRLTQDEARMTVTQTFGVVHGLINNMRIVMDDGKVSTSGIRQSLVTLHQVVNDINKMKRSLLPYSIHLYRKTEVASQVTNYKERSYGGSLLQTLQRIMTLSRRHAIKGPQHGSFKEKY